MARSLRTEFAGAWYHVMHRGLGRRHIFKTDAHRTLFLELLEQAAVRYGAEWHAYCLMTHHYHLLVRTPEPNLQRIMRDINGMYTQAFNRSARADGPLFHGRYHALLVDPGVYAQRVSAHIHRDPLRAGLVRRLAAYPWSSYPAYVGKVPAPSWLHTREILELGAPRDRRARYQTCVERETDPELEAFYARTRRGPVLGAAAFRAALRRRSAADAEGARRRTGPRRPTANQVLRAVAEAEGVARNSLLVSRRGKASQGPGRAMAMYLCQEAGGMRLQAIADMFGLAGYAGAGGSIRAFRRRLREDAALARRVERLRRDLMG